MIRSFPKSILKVSLHLFIFNSFTSKHVNVSKVIMVANLVLRLRFGYVHVSVERYMYVFGPNITHFDIRDLEILF